MYSHDDACSAKMITGSGKTTSEAATGNRSEAQKAEV